MLRVLNWKWGWNPWPTFLSHDTDHITHFLQTRIWKEIIKKKNKRINEEKRWGVFFYFRVKPLNSFVFVLEKKKLPPLSSLSLMWRLSFSAEALGGLKRGGILCVACTYQKFSCHAIQAQDKRERHDIHVPGAIFCAKIKWDTKKTKEKKMIAIWNSQVRTFVQLTTWRKEERIEITVKY